MVTALARVINDGRVTVPVEIREELSIEEGDKVVIDVQPVEGVGDSRDDR